MIVRRILAFEWAALFLLGASVGLLAILAANPFFVLPALLAWVAVALSLVVGGLLTAIRDPLSISQRVRTALAVPIAIAAPALILLF